MKTKPNDFAYNISNYFQIYLPNERGFSTNTISSYRDAFIQLLQFFKNIKRVNSERITISMITSDLVKEFLQYIENSGKSVSTRNQRLAAIKTFFKYLQYVAPEHILLSQKVLGIKLKIQKKSSLNYLTIDGIGLVLAQPSATTRSGYRDMLLLTLLYDSGARVSELINIKIGDLRLITPATIVLHGKGSKSRIVPLSAKTAKLVENYLLKEKHNSQEYNCLLLFKNRSGDKLTRAGVTYILAKYADLARKENAKLIPMTLTPHCFRHSKAMHLLQAGVALIYIRDFLGHEQIKTTEIYAKADSESKRKAIENAYPPIINDEKFQSSWNDDAELMS